MNFFGRRDRSEAKPSAPVLPRAPVAPSAPRPSIGARPASQRSVGSVPPAPGSGRVSTSSQSTPEPDARLLRADFGNTSEDDGAGSVQSGDEAALDAGWGVSERPPGSHGGSGGQAALAVAENRARVLEAELQAERRLRKEAQDALMGMRSRLSTPQTSSKAGGGGSKMWEITNADMLMDTGTQTDVHPMPGREELDSKIEEAVRALQRRNDALEIENQMLQAAVDDKDREMQQLRSDNQVLWAEQDSVRAAKDDFKDLQEQLAEHIKAGNLITKRPSSTRIMRADVPKEASQDVICAAPETSSPKFETSRSVATIHGLQEVSEKGSHSGRRLAIAPEADVECLAMGASGRQNSETSKSWSGPEPLMQKEPESALSNFVGIFQGEIRSPVRQSCDDDDSEPIDDFRQTFGLHSENAYAQYSSSSFAQASTDSQESAQARQPAAILALPAALEESLRQRADHDRQDRTPVTDCSKERVEEATLRQNFNRDRPRFSIMGGDRERADETVLASQHAIADKAKTSVAEYRRSVGDYRKGIAALEAKLRPATADKSASGVAFRTRTHNRASSRERDDTRFVLGTID